MGCDGKATFCSIHYFLSINNLLLFIIIDEKRVLLLIMGLIINVEIIFYIFVETCNFSGL